MSDARESRAAATRIQRAVADPAVSATVRAGAGSGKTRVLVDRIVRLCLAGADPKSIVAVTFTKKAAVEIKQRLLERLRDLAAAADDAARRQLLFDLLDRDPTPDELARSAALYDRFLEDLPGLPIGTIHGWCQRLLSRFAADVGLDPAFAVLEQTDELWEEALDLLEAETAADAERRADLAALAPTPSGARQALTDLFQDRLALDRWLGRLAAARGESPLGRDRSALLPELLADQRRALLRGTPLAGLVDPGPDDLAPALAEGARALAAAVGPDGSVRAVAPKGVTAGLARQLDKIAAAPDLVREWLAAPDDAARAAVLARLRALPLTLGNKLRVLNGAKAGKEERAVAFAAAARPLLAAVVLIDLIELSRANARLLRCGLAALDLYERLKRRDRVIDFHDLELLARHLVVESEQRHWVQYRLDAATEHLLVDEFQDTNHNQWEILEPLVEEFRAGLGAHATPPTVFVVGDVKQSIYRFRGAEPGLFHRVEARLREEGAELPALTETLPTNFRSVPAIVRAVGRLFSAAPLRGLLPAGEAAHVAQFPDRDPSPGDEVVFVPPLAAGDGAGDDEEGPVDRAAGLAARVVRRLRDSEGFAWSDILVLCRQRTHIGAYESALRDAGVPIVPSGRGALARSREVQDILLLLRWLAFPDDNPALASVLRSPLFRLGEAPLQRLLAARRRRGGSLWGALQRAGGEAELAVPAARLTFWRRHAGREGCHELLRRIYRDADAPDRFAAALGEQARWNLLRLHDLALALDLGPHPSLRRFADLIARAAETAAEEEANLPEHGAGRVRVMTVHGAKGLEARAVVFVDAAAPLRGAGERLRLEPGQAAGPLLLGLKAALRDGPDLPDAGESLLPPAAREAVAAAKTASGNEDANLLYVALTRARDRLYVLGSRGRRDGGRPSHLGWLQDAVDAAAADGDPNPLPARWERPAWLADPTPGAVPGPGPAAPPPAETGGVIPWAPPPHRPRYELRNPSSLAPARGAPPPDEGTSGREDTRFDAAASATGEAPAAAADAAERGTAIHLWLQLAAEPAGLPAEDAPLLGAVPAAGWTADALAEARAVAANPALAWIFRPATAGGRGWSEAALIHQVDADPVPLRVYGAIDRLVARGNRIDVIDYKSNHLAGDAARVAAEIARLRAHYAPQLDAYRAAAAALFPGCEVAAHLLFTHAKDDAGNQGRLVPVAPPVPA